MNKYRSHLCSDLSIKNLGEKVTLSGWPIQLEIMVIYYLLI